MPIRKVISAIITDILEDITDGNAEAVASPDPGTNNVQLLDESVCSLDHSLVTDTFGDPVPENLNY